jgi:hypothetical protein
MTQDDIIFMARASGWMSEYESSTGFSAEAAFKFANLVAQHERERIAQMIEDAPPLVDFCKNDKSGCLICGFTPSLAAQTIRELE